MLEIFIVWITSSSGNRWIDSHWTSKERAEIRQKDIQDAMSWTGAKIYFDVQVQPARLNDAVRADNTEQPEPDGDSSC